MQFPNHLVCMVLRRSFSISQENRGGCFYERDFGFMMIASWEDALDLTSQVFIIKIWASGWR